MANPSNPKPSIFQKVLEAGNSMLDAQIMKAKTTIINSNIEEDFLYSKTITEDPNYSTHAQGWMDKPFRIQNSYLKQMSTQDSPVAAVIQTRQNQGASHSKLVKSKQEKGFVIALRDEDALLEKIKEELRAEMEVKGHPDSKSKQGKSVDENAPDEEPLDENTDPIVKADGEVSPDDTSMEGISDDTSEDNGDTDDEVEEYNWEIDRKAREKLSKQFETARKTVEEYILNCGKTDNRPFETQQWNFDAALRAWIRDSLTYDLYTTEIVPDRAGRPHHWFPNDAGTIKYSSANLKNYKDMSENFINMDILYPEKTEIAAEKQKVIDLKPDLLEKGMYKYVQVIRGKIERAFTADELKIGIRNKTTDIFVNGYGISELELLVSLVIGHLNAEYYNQAYFTQGFSAKGILHIKSAINRRKLETVRQQWQHMVRGTKNAFQTPIFAGVDEVKWIPLTQNHNDIGFEGWMRYLVTMISSIFQIDPAEMGIHFSKEGGGSHNLGGGANDTDVKLSNSKDKGLYPLMRHIENYINEGIIKPFDSRFVIKFTGLTDETPKQVLERQEKEVKFKKTVNEIRMEDGLPPLPGMDDIILDAQYMAWYNAYSKKAQAKQDKSDAQQQKLTEAQAKTQDPEAEEDNAVDPQNDIYGEGATQMVANPDGDFGDVNKSLTKKAKYKKMSVEIYKIEK